MSYFIAREALLSIDKTADIISLQIGPHMLQMTLGEWSKMISMPATVPRVVIALEKGE